IGNPQFEPTCTIEGDLSKSRARFRRTAPGARGRSELVKKVGFFISISSCHQPPAVKEIP
ncbi:MAG: hypothetical protein JXA30_02325, partial [Deltaproteobacteria bacterium]|nr:hypothetical protein [Deltaproteobacteria bacterium]